jgi:hypothetical protein
MKATALILLAGFIFFSGFSYAQSQHSDKKIQSQQQFKGVTKGYYSIYNNSEKLNTETINVRYKKEANDGRRSSLSSGRKGFYSIRNNQMDTVIEIYSRKNAFSGNVPVIKKGYYSIGRNAELLQK